MVEKPMLESNINVLPSRWFLSRLKDFQRFFLDIYSHEDFR